MNFSKILNLPPKIKMLIYLSIDGVSLSILVFILSFMPSQFASVFWFLVPLSLLCAWLVKIYHRVTRFSRFDELPLFFKAQTTATTIFFVATLIIQHEVVEQWLLIFWLASPLMMISARVFAARLLSQEKNNQNQKPKVVMVGDKKAIVDAITFIKSSMNVVGIFQNNQESGRYLSNIELQPLKQFESWSKGRTIDKIILAFSQASDVEKALHFLSNFHIPVRIFPTADVILEKKQTIRDVRLEDLLTRKPVKAKKTLLIKDIQNKTVLITGAGGSIGSELVKQIAHIQPKKILTLDNSEAALFYLQNTIEKKFPKLKTHFVLGSILDKTLLVNLFEYHKIDTVYHAAAYKHVDLGEKILL